MKVDLQLNLRRSCLRQSLAWQVLIYGMRIYLTMMKKEGCKKERSRMKNRWGDRRPVDGKREDREGRAMMGFRFLWTVERL